MCDEAIGEINSKIQTAKKDAGAYVFVDTYKGNVIDDICFLLKEVDRLCSAIEKHKGVLYQGNVPADVKDFWNNDLWSVLDA